jgi:16S rRNA (uracil1498-N3)-methyltransferase
MHRFYIDHIDGDKVYLTDSEQLHHLKDVLRLKVDNEVIVFDNQGNEYAGVSTKLERKQAELRITPIKSTRNHKTKLTLACAIPKGSRMDDIIDYLTQIGVERIIPMWTERVVVKLDDVKTESRLKRWRKIAQNAARQSQRSSIPLIEPMTRLEDVISDSHDYDLKLIPTLAGERRLIKDAIAEARPNNIIVLIGPEGDFTSEEIELAQSEGFIPMSLGDTVLRVATAAVAVASYLKFALDN